MRPQIVIRIFAGICISTAFATIASACQCGGGLRGKNAWENAKEATEKSAIVFEGKPIRFDLRWRLLTAKEEELVPADAFPLASASEPRMMITFQVQRVYKGDLGSEIQLETGLGGGDCGAIYATGLSYLLYADDSNNNVPSVSMCSPGGWIEDRRIGINLRYLRHEPPLAEDLQPTQPWWVRPNATATQERWYRDAEERRKRYDSATGRICGRVIGPDAKANPGGTLGFLSTQGYSPAGYPDASLNEDGSFCSRSLGPGKYYLFFVRGPERGALAEYYPGVTDIAKATAIEVAAGQTSSKIVFKLADESSYSIRGFVSAENNAAFGKGVQVFLVRTDGDRRTWYQQTVTLSPLIKVGYFKLENIPPGDYSAFVQSVDLGWWTRKVDVNVSSHMKFILLKLVHK